MSSKSKFLPIISLFFSVAKDPQKSSNDLNNALTCSKNLTTFRPELKIYIGCYFFYLWSWPCTSFYQVHICFENLTVNHCSSDTIIAKNQSFAKNIRKITIYNHLQKMLEKLHKFRKSCNLKQNINRIYNETLHYNCLQQLPNLRLKT